MTKLKGKKLTYFIILIHGSMRNKKLVRGRESETRSKRAKERESSPVEQSKQLTVVLCSHHLPLVCLLSPATYIRFGPTASWGNNEAAINRLLLSHFKLITMFIIQMLQNSCSLAVTAGNRDKKQSSSFSINISHVLQHKWQALVWVYLAGHYYLALFSALVSPEGLIC